MKHTRFVKTPIITDTLHLQVYQRGQWIRLAWCDKPSRFFGISERGTVTAFHYPRAATNFVSYARAGKPRVEIKRERETLATGSRFSRVAYVNGQPVATLTNDVRTVRQARRLLSLS